jgi:hypothetical protein
MLWQIISIVSLLGFAISSEPECDPHCYDVHRYCDSLRLGQEPIIENKFEQAEFDEHDFSCEDAYWLERCPHTCETCISCIEMLVNDSLSDNRVVESDLTTQAPTTAEQGKQFTGSFTDAATCARGSDILSYNPGMWVHEHMIDTDEQTGIYTGGCYHSGTERPAWAEVCLDGDYSVSSVSILATDSSNSIYTPTTEAFVCEGADGDNCVSCGKYTSYSPDSWNSLQCPSNTHGSYLRFENQNTYMAFCGVKFSS